MNTSLEHTQPSINLDDLVNAHADALYAYAITRLRFQEDAEDAVQETLLAAIKSHQSFRGASADRTWLIGILRHKIIDQIRRRTRQEKSATVDRGVEALFTSTDRWATPPNKYMGH